MSNPKRPKDINQLAKLIVDMSTGNTKPKNPHAVALGRSGGLKGGKARAENLTKKQLSEIGKKGAMARWGKPK